MDKKTLGVAIGTLTLGVSGQTLADSPFQTSSMTQAYNTADARGKVATQVCGGKNEDSACNATLIKTKACSDADYQEFKAFKQSKYFQEFKNSPSYKAFKAEQPKEKKSSTEGDTKSKSSACSAGACGG